MAFYKKGDFAKMIGMTPGNLYRAVKDGKVIVDGKLIDSEDPINLNFIQHRKNLLEQKGDSLVPQTPVDESMIQKSSDSVANKASEQFSKYKLDKEDAELRQKIAQASMAEVKLKEMVGSSLPTGLVKNVMSMLGQSFITNYKNGVDAIVAEFSHRKKLSPVEMAEMKGEIVKIVNEAHSISIGQAVKEVRNLVLQHTKSFDDQD